MTPIRIFSMIAPVMKMEDIVMQGLLYDFYGELLTEHQRNIYEDAIFNDLSLGEIAEVKGISRQGVHDLIKRCDKTLQVYESKLHLIRKFQQTKEKVARIHELTKNYIETGNMDCIREIENISSEIIDLE